MTLELVEVAAFSPEKQSASTKQKVSNLDLSVPTVATQIQAVTAMDASLSPNQDTAMTISTQKHIHLPSQSNDDAPPLNVNRQKSVFEELLENKWYKFFSSCFIWTRVVVLLLSIFLFCLSLSYCTAQFLEAKLELITDCSERIKTREQIWRHSYESSLKYSSDHKLNEESQVMYMSDTSTCDKYQGKYYIQQKYGYTTEPCWTTKPLEVDTEKLWYSNQYDSQRTNGVNTKSVLFGIIVLFCGIIIVYTLISFIIDIVSMVRGTLHRRSKFYAPYRQRESRRMSKDKKK